MYGQTRDCREADLIGFPQTGYAVGDKQIRSDPAGSSPPASLTAGERLQR